MKFPLLWLNVAFFAFVILWAALHTLAPKTIPWPFDGAVYEQPPLYQQSVP